MTFSRGLFLIWLLPCVVTATALAQTANTIAIGADPLPKGALLRMGSSRLAHGNRLTSVCFSFGSNCRSGSASCSAGRGRWSG